jgi:hypothetical protein
MTGLVLLPMDHHSALLGMTQMRFQNWEHQDTDAPASLQLKTYLWFHYCSKSWGEISFAKAVDFLRVKVRWQNPNALPSSTPNQGPQKRNGTVMAARDFTLSSPS